MSPRVGCAYPGRLLCVNGMCGPYTSLFTNSQSPMSIVGIMLPDGIRYASIRNVRSTRKIAIVPAADLNISQTRRRLQSPPDLPPRAAATLFLGLSDVFLAATIQHLCCPRYGKSGEGASA